MRSLSVHVRRSLFGALLGAALILGGGCQFAVDAYVGPNFPSNEDATLKTNVPPIPSFTISGKADYDGGVTFGGRTGFWFDALPMIDVGIFADVSRVTQEVDDADFDFVPISLLPMVRVSLMKTDEIPNGRLQPYVGLGPSLVYSELDNGNLEDSSWDVALDARAGVTYMLLKSFGLFTEYRATYFEPNFDDTVPGAAGSSVRAELDSVTHHVLFGTTFRF